MEQHPPSPLATSMSRLSETRSEFADYIHGDLLISAVAAGDHAGVQQLLQQGHSARAGEGCVTGLHIAARKGDVDMVRALVCSGADVSALSEGGTPLHCAAQAGCLDCVAALLGAGSHLDALSPEGLTPVMAAALANEEAAVIALITAGADLALAFLPGTSTNLLHVCAEQDLVAATAAALRAPGGPRLARCPGSDLKPVHSAVLNLGGLGTPQESTDLINLLLPHSGLGATTSRADLRSQADLAQMGYDSRMSTPMCGARAPEFDGTEASGSGTPCGSEAAAAAQQQQHPRAALVPPPLCVMGLQVATPTLRLPSRNNSLFRMALTPTANLACTPSDCSPLSHFHATREASPTGACALAPHPSDPLSPVADTRFPSTPFLGSLGPVNHSARAASWDNDACVSMAGLSVRSHLTVRTRAADVGASPFCGGSGSGSGSSASTAHAVPRPSDAPTPVFSSRSSADRSDRAEGFNLALLAEACRLPR